ncbi:MAG: hypothetical protein ACRC10_11585 [Thermoguttaceae bacterium]
MIRLIINTTIFIPLFLLSLVISGCTTATETKESGGVDPTDSFFAPSLSAATNDESVGFLTSEEEEKILAGIEKSFGSYERPSNGPIVAVNLAEGRTSVDDATLLQVVRLPHLKKLQISGAGLSKETIFQIGQIPVLEELALQDTPMLDEDLIRLIGRLPGLTRLRLRRLQDVSDIGFAELSKLQHLQVLALLESPQLSQAGLQAIARLPNLRSLDLRGCSALRAEDYAVLQNMPQLRELKIGSFSVDDAVLETVAQLPKLESLTIEDAKLSQEQLAAFLNRTEFQQQIKTLGFARMLGSVNDKTLALLKESPQLKTLMLKQIPINGSFLQGWNSPIETLTLDRAMLKPDSFDSIAQLKSLRRLDLSGVYLSSDSLARLAILPELESLNLSECLLQTDDLEPLETFLKLREVNLNGNPDLSEEVRLKWNR